MYLASKGKPSGGCLICKRTLDIAEKHKRKSIEEHREEVRLNYDKYKELKAVFAENIGYNHEGSIDRGKGNVGTGILRITPISIKNFAYHRYYFTYKNAEWVLGLEEVAINGEVFEQPYFIAKK